MVGENLRKALDWLPQARALLTIKCDVPLPVHVSNLTPNAPDRDKLRELFSRFEFKTWLRELDTSGEAGGARAERDSEAHVQIASGEAVALDPAMAQAGQYETILTEAQLDAWLGKINHAPLTAVDTETTSLDAMQARLVGISLAVSALEGAYLPLAHVGPGAPQQLDLQHALKELKPWLEDASKPKLGQHLKYDKHVLANYGITLAGIVHDTLLESYVLEAHKPHDMDSLAQRHLGYKTITFEEVAGKGAKQIGFDQVDVETATRYAAEDADITLRLHQVLYPQIAREPQLDAVYKTIELPAMAVLWEMERVGVLIDVNLLNAQSNEIGKKLVELESQAHALAGQPFNLNSPKQIQEILFDQLQLPVKKKTPSGAPSTDEEVLAELALDYPLPKVLLEYRGLAKLKSTYTDKLPRMVDSLTGRVHTSYNQAVAVTGRLASSDPNRAPRQRAGVGRLFANRAAHHCASVARRRLAESLRRRPGRAPRHRSGSVWRRCG